MGDSRQPETSGDREAGTPEARVRELERMVADLRVLQDFSSTLLHHHLSIDDILWDVVRLAVARLNLEDCVIYLRDRERGDLVQRAAFGPKNPKEREILNPIRLPIGRGIVGSVAQTGQVELITDTRQDARYVQDDEMRLSELAVPIFQGGDVIGVIDSEHSRLGFFTEWHRELFVAIAAMAGSRITAAELEEQRLGLATRDPLTGLANRAELFRVLQERLDRAHSTVAVVFIDLDHFGVINDSLSHLAGDELLRTVGERIRDRLPAGAVGARFGGDEFVVVLETDAVLARAFAEDLVSVISRVLRGGAIEGLHVDCSAGVAMGLAGASAAEVIQQADLAMYHAKRSGRARVQMHDGALAAARRREQQLVIDMERTLERRGPEIAPHFQPIHSLADGRMHGAEMLARWRHPDLGPISPLEFVAAAERTGNIHALGRHLLQQALRHMAGWSTQDRTLVFHVNVSPLQIQHDGFVTQLLDLMAGAGLPHESLACEVTESALLGDDARAHQVLDRLVSEGVHLVLDDFGTGYASHSMLTRFRFAGIKIDRSFVHGMMHDRGQRAIVRSLIALSQDLGMECTAEGAERADQILLLQDLGCPLVQGRFIADAMPAEDLSRRLGEIARLPAQGRG